MKARFQLSILADGNTLSVGTDATVAVKLPGTSTIATLYSNCAGTATTTNPLPANSAGNVACYVTPGRYDLTITTADGTVTLSDYECVGVGVLDDVSANTAAITALQGPIITDNTTERVIGNSDAWGYIRMTNAGASTVTVPAGLTFAAGTEITVFAAGSAGVSFVASGTTINAVALGLEQYRAATLKYLGSNAYDLIGGLV